LQVFLQNLSWIPFCFFSTNRFDEVSTAIHGGPAAGVGWLATMTLSLQKEALVNLVMFGLFAFYYTYWHTIKTEYLSFFASQQNWGMCRNNELGMSCLAIFSKQDMPNSLLRHIPQF